jgi:hypothetical protein
MPTSSLHLSSSGSPYLPTPGLLFLGAYYTELHCYPLTSRTVAAEVSSNPLREKTLAVGSWSGFGVGLAVGFVSPYIQNPEYAGLGGKIGFIWMAFSIISGVYVYFFLPELKG